MEWVTNDFAKYEVQQSSPTSLLDIEKVPLKGFFRCPRRACHCDFSQ
jgi:hypothetical protein